MSLQIRLSEKEIKMMTKKNVIWSTWDLFDLVDDKEFFEDYLEMNEMEETFEDLAEYRKFDIVDEYMQDCLDAQRTNLDVDVHSPIIAIADLGLWDGRVTGYKELKSSNISDCLYTDCDFAEWYCDAYDFRAKMEHHDGTNYILYRMRKENISDTQWETFLWKIYEGKADRADITRYTKSLMPYIANVYGWKYRDYSKERKVA